MFHILQCGYRFVHREPLCIDRAGLPFYVFVHYRTEAEAELGGSFVPLQGSWILFPPGEPHRYRSCALPYENDWVHFTSPQGTEFFRELGIPLGKPLWPLDTSPIDHTLQNLLNLQEHKGTSAEFLASSCLACLFYDLSRISPTGGAKPSGRRYEHELFRLRTDLFRKPSAGTTVDSLAAQIGLSGSYLQALYKAQFGVSIGEDIIRGRLDRAKYLLTNSETPVSAVAEASGYRCEAHFMRQFKRMTGITPGEYRRRTRT